MKEELLNIEKTGKNIESIFATTKKISIPIKFDVSQFNFNIQLLEMNFLPFLKDAREKLENLKDEQPSESKRKSSSLQTFLENFKNNTIANTSDNATSERFNTNQSSRSRNVYNGNSNPEQKSPTTVRTKVNLNNSALFRVKQNGDQEQEVLPKEGDVNLYNFKNIYDSKTRVNHFQFQRLSTQSKIMPRESFQSSQNRKNGQSTSQSKEIGQSLNGTQTSRPRMTEKFLSRQSSFNDLKFSSKYQKNVISIEDDFGLISNQFVDEMKFKNMLMSLKTLPKNVKLVEIKTNTFVCNPVTVLAKYLTEKQNSAIVLDLKLNKILCGLNHSKRDVELLKNLNVEILN